MTQLIVLMGPPGSGKTTHAEHLRKQGYSILSVDQIREELGYPPGGGSHKHVFNTTYRLLDRQLYSGWDVVFDSTALHPSTRKHLRRTARRFRAEPHLHVVHAEPETIRQRNRDRQPEPIPTADLEEMLTTYQREYPIAVGSEPWESARVIDGTKPRPT